MRIDSVETIRPVEHPNLCLVRLHAGDLTGIGETFFGGDTVEAFIHEQAAPQLLGRNALERDALGEALQTYLGHTGSGVARRSRSAIDIALWDIAGKHAGVSLTTLLGGQQDRRVSAYNTCAGPTYVRNPSRQTSSNWGLGSNGAYSDLRKSIDQPAELALELAEEGYPAMKIWPFDTAAERCRGTIPRVSDIEDGIAPIEAIREAAGDRIAVMVEMHGLWSVPGARLIVDALEDYPLVWIEDPVRPTGIDGLTGITQNTSTPVAVGETIGDPAGYLQLIQRGAADVVVVDVGWCGGVGVAMGIARVAHWHQMPIAFHDCSGPIQFTASVHLAASVENAPHQEMVRAFYHGWYGELVTGLPTFHDGALTPPSAPGLGVQLRDDLGDRIRTRTSK
ncbi:MAG: mandelate racemase/muconate lactonizing enzyme family protein [Acidimicrobiia bacterium]|jgi:L-alanine-DL-glutamate epimerase-like enolase superfamily enzyme